MTEEVFWSLTPKLFSLYVETYEKKQTASVQLSWEQLRWQTTLLLQPHYKQTLRPKDIAVFPWEEDNIIQLEPVKDVPAHYQAIAAAMDAQYQEKLQNASNR